MKKLFYIIFILFNLSLYADNKSLKELIDIALENNTDISKSKLQAANKRASVGIEKSAYLPQASVVGELANYQIKDSQNRKEDGGVQSIGLTVTQLLYDFGKTTSSISSSKEELKATMQELISTSSNTVLNVKNAYYNILNQYKLIEVAKESVKIDQLQLEQASEYFKAGVKTKIDVTNAQLQLSNSKLDLLRSKYDLKTAKTKLITILGKKIDKNFEVKTDQKDIIALSKSVVHKRYDLDKLINDAINQRAEMAMNKALIQAQKEQYNSTKAQYLPSINFKGDYSDSNADNIPTKDIEQTSAGIYLQWDFFTGLRTQSSVKQQLSNLKTAKEDLKYQELLIIEQVTESYYQLKESIDSLNIALLNVDLGAQTLELAQERYINGLNDIVELNSSKLSFIQAKNDLVNTYYNYKTSIANLEYAIGVIYK